MPTITLPAPVTAPIPSDLLDDTIAANRAKLIELVNGHNDQEARLSAAPPVPSPVATIVLTPAIESALAPLMNATAGQVVILRGATRDRVVQSQ